MRNTFIYRHNIGISIGIFLAWYVALFIMAATPILLPARSYACERWYCYYGPLSIPRCIALPC